MLRIIMRVLSAGLAAQGAFMLWIARYGMLWEYPTDLGWFAPYVLRPGMYAIGSLTVVMGLWYAWLAYTTAGRVLATWADDMCHDLAAGAVADLGAWTVACLYARELWFRRGCMIGRHDPAAATYIPREGMVCENCGLPVPMRLTLADRLDSAIAGHAAPLWRWLHRKEIERGDWLPGDEREDFGTVGTITGNPHSEDEGIYVLYPDGRCRMEDRPDDGCFTQGSDAVVRRCSGED